MDGDRPAQDTHDAPRSYCLLAMQELGLVPHAADDTIRATIDSYYRLGLIPAEAAESVGCDRPLWRSLERERPGSYLGFDRVLYHRTPTRKEIDFVGPELGGWAIESKYVDGRWRRDAQTLAASGWRGIVATRSELNLDDPEVAAIPVALLAWLLDS